MIAEPEIVMPVMWPPLLTLASIMFVTTTTGVQLLARFLRARSVLDHALLANPAHQAGGFALVAKLSNAQFK